MKSTTLAIAVLLSATTLACTRSDATPDVGGAVQPTLKKLQAQPAIVAPDLAKPDTQGGLVPKGIANDFEDESSPGDLDEDKAVSNLPVTSQPTKKPPAGVPLSGGVRETDPRRGDAPRDERIIGEGIDRTLPTGNEPAGGGAEPVPPTIGPGGKPPQP